MSQPVRTVNDVIVKAFRSIGILSPDQTPTGAQVEDGLYFINDALLRLSKAGLTIPVMELVSFPIVAGKDIYTIGDDVTSDATKGKLISINTINVVYNEASYPVTEINDSQLFNRTRSVNQQGFPSYVIKNKETYKTSLQFFPVPQKDFTCNLRGKFALDKVELNDQFDELPPEFQPDIRNYLEVHLSGAYPSANLPSWKLAEYNNFLTEISKGSKQDMSIRSSGILQRKNGYWYNDCNSPYN